MMQGVMARWIILLWTSLVGVCLGDLVDVMLFDTDNSQIMMFHGVRLLNEGPEHMTGKLKSIRVPASSENELKVLIGTCQVTDCVPLIVMDKEATDEQRDSVVS
eukprot:sb/3478075/